NDGLWRSRLRYGGQHGDLNISANVSRLETDGYRDHSETRRDIANLRLGWDLDDASSLTLLINSLHQPGTQDPLGLTRDQLRQDNDDLLTLMVYGGERGMQQFLGFSGGNPGAGGGVIELDRRFGGGELGWQRDTRLFDLPVTLAAGIAYHYQGEQRRG